MAPNGEEAAQQLIDSHGKAVNVVGVPLQLGLVGARLAPCQLGNGDSHEDHEKTGGEIFIICLALWSLPQRGQK